MINLTPDDYKNDVRFARRNTILLHWLVGLLLVLSVAAATTLLGKTYLQSQTRHYAALNTQTEQDLKSRDLEGTLNTVEKISGNLKLIVQVLSRQVIFSQLIKQVGAVMPENSTLSTIELSKIDGGLDLTAQAKDYNTATQVQVNLSDPNSKLFDKVDIVSINCEGLDPAYPCRITLRALFTKNNPYLFVNQKGNQ